MHYSVGTTIIGRIYFAFLTNSPLKEQDLISAVFGGSGLGEDGVRGKEWEQHG